MGRTVNGLCPLVCCRKASVGVPQGQTESGGIVLAVICWSPSAQRQCGPSRRCAHRPSVASRLSINFSLSLSLSLLILFSLLPENGFPSLATASLATPDPQEAEARPGRKSRRTRRYRPGGGQPYLRALDDRFITGVPPTGAPATVPATVTCSYIVGWHR